MLVAVSTYLPNIASGFSARSEWPVDWLAPLDIPCPINATFDRRCAAEIWEKMEVSY